MIFREFLIMGGEVYAQSDGSAIWSGFGDSQSDLISLVICWISYLQFTLLLLFIYKSFVMCLFIDFPNNVPTSKTGINPKKSTQNIGFII